MKPQKIDDIMFIVFNNRRRIFNESNQKDEINKQENTFEKLLSLIYQIQKIQNNEVKLMLSYLMINVTKYMEENFISPEGVKRFELKEQKSWFIDIIIQYGLEGLCQKEILIQPFKQFKVLPCVKQRFKNRIELISDIAKQEITNKHLDDYFRQIKIYQFFSQGWPFIQTISSYDGKFIFMKSDAGSKTVDYQVLEFAAINNFFYWLIKNDNPYLIINEIFDVNRYLDVEFSVYYAHQAYGHEYQKFHYSQIIRFWNL
ncbi:hypothetical protein pb186bvf_015788 [Paramecium bursaria]